MKHRECWEYIENYHAVDELLHANDLLKLNIGAEVGVRYGVFSHYLLSQNPRLIMHLVDPYEPYLDCDGLNYTKALQDRIYHEAEHRLRKYVGRVIWRHEPSVVAATRILNSTLDFVFIDAVHEYNEVLKDIETWWPKLRPGGMLSGHDFNIVGVAQAVTKFAGKVERSISYISWPAEVWAIVKASDIL